MNAEARQRHLNFGHVFNSLPLFAVFVTAYSYLWNAHRAQRKMARKIC
jgi:hypothetical protein